MRRFVRCVRGQFCWAPTLSGKVMGPSSSEPPTGFWCRCIPHETAFRENGNPTVPAVLRRVMASIWWATIESKPRCWKTGVGGLRRYYRERAPEHFQCELSRRTVYRAIEVLCGLGMVRRLPTGGLQATDDFCRAQEGGDMPPVTIDQLAMIPPTLLTPTFPMRGDQCIDFDVAAAWIKRNQALGLKDVASKAERKRALHRDVMRRARTDSPSQDHVTLSEAQIGGAVTLSQARCDAEPGTLNSSSESGSPAPEVGHAPHAPAAFPPEPPESDFDARVLDYLHPDDECGLVYSSHGFMVGIDKDSDQWYRPELDRE